jgi:hypothetical protein
VTTKSKKLWCRFLIFRGEYSANKLRGHRGHTSKGTAIARAEAIARSVASRRSKNKKHGHYRQTWQINVAKVCRFAGGSRTHTSMHTCNVSPEGRMTCRARPKSGERDYILDSTRVLRPGRMQGYKKRSR